MLGTSFLRLLLPPPLRPLRRQRDREQWLFLHPWPRSYRGGFGYGFGFGFPMRLTPLHERRGIRLSRSTPSRIRRPEVIRNEHLSALGRLHPRQRPDHVHVGRRLLLRRPDHHPAL